MKRVNFKVVSITKYGGAIPYGKEFIVSHIDHKYGRVFFYLKSIGKTNGYFPKRFKGGAFYEWLVAQNT
jgi:hypothetical protein